MEGQGIAVEGNPFENLEGFESSSVNAVASNTGIIASTENNGANAFEGIVGQTLIKLPGTIDGYVEYQFILGIRTVFDLHYHDYSGMDSS